MDQIERFRRCYNFKTLFLLIFLKSISIVIFFNGDLLKNRFLEKEQWIECVNRIPSEKEIIIDNLVWQILKTPHGRLKFFNAYLDTRQNKSVVRINSNGPRIYIQNKNLYCQFWFESEAKLHQKVVKASDIQSMVPSELK